MYVCVLGVVEKEGIWEISVPSTQYCCEPKTSKKVFFFFFFKLQGANVGSQLSQTMCVCVGGGRIRGGPCSLIFGESGYCRCNFFPASLFILLCEALPRC